MGTNRWYILSKFISKKNIIEFSSTLNFIDDRRHYITALLVVSTYYKLNVGMSFTKVPQLQQNITLAGSVY